MTGIKMTNEYPYAHFEKDHLLSLSYVTEIDSKFMVSYFSNTGSQEDLMGGFLEFAPVSHFVRGLV